MASLAVAKPILSFETGPAGSAVLEQPVTVQATAPALPPGATLPASGFSTAGWVVTRRTAFAAPEELWNEEQKQWEPYAPHLVDNREPLAFQSDPADPTAFAGLLLAASKTDAGGEPSFRPAVAGFPEYRARAVFRVEVHGEQARGLSAPSDPLRFVSLTDSMLAGVRVGPDQTANDADQVHLFLRDQARNPIGELSMLRSGAGASLSLTVGSASGAVATMTIAQNGDVEFVAHADNPARRATLRSNASGDLELEAATRIQLTAPRIVLRGDMTIEET